ncbi:hypothetical protein V8C86DRAFT_2514130 [Haematococcus lacustris]
MVTRAATSLATPSDRIVVATLAFSTWVMSFPAAMARTTLMENIALPEMWWSPVRTLFASSAAALPSGVGGLGGSTML